jgi:hypothetical protein
MKCKMGYSLAGLLVKTEQMLEKEAIAGEKLMDYEKPAYKNSKRDRPARRRKTGRLSKK